MNGVKTNNPKSLTTTPPQLLEPPLLLPPPLTQVFQEKTRSLIGVRQHLTGNNISPALIHMMPVDLPLAVSPLRGNPKPAELQAAAP